MVAIAITEDMYSKIMQAQGIGSPRLLMVRVRQFRWIDDGYSAFTHHLQPPISLKHGTGILINPDPQAFGMSCHGTHQTCHTIPVVKMLIHDNLRDDPQTRC